MDDSNKALAELIKKEVAGLPSSFPDCCIFQVPENLRSISEAAYRPLVVSIGPFHCNDERLRPMEEYKLRYLRTFMTNWITNKELEDCVEIIRGCEVEIRQQYLQNFVLRSDDFIKMVLVDSVFIIELFRRLTHSTLQDENDPMFYKWRMVDNVHRDLLLLENQLPIFVLEKVYKFAFEDNSFSSLTCKFFNIREVNVRRFKHFVDLLRFCHLPSSLRPGGNNGTKFYNAVSATFLYGAGVKFEPCTKNSLLDIEFDQGSLKMPKLELNAWTESFFRNLMVFEQFHYSLDTYIIDYFSFLDNLIKTPNDVSILVKCGVIDNYLGNNEDVSNFFNAIGKHYKMYYPRFYYSNVCNELNKFYNNSWNRNVTILKQEYLKHPWVVISVIYAVVILILTIVQATTGVISNIQSS